MNAHNVLYELYKQSQNTYFWKYMNQYFIPYFSTHYSYLFLGVFSTVVFFYLFSKNENPKLSKIMSLKTKLENLATELSDLYEEFQVSNKESKLRLDMQSLEQGEIRNIIRKLNERIGHLELEHSE